jgi:hypothetical protein
MIIFKSCPRCSGDRSLEQDFYGWYVLCLTCGYVTYPETGLALGGVGPAERPRQTALREATGRRQA